MYGFATGSYDCSAMEFKGAFGQPKETLFGIDYFEQNKITKMELAFYRTEYRIPDLVRWRISRSTESLNNPKDNEVVFFTDILKLNVRLQLQPAVQNILAHLGYASGSTTQILRCR